MITLILVFIYFYLAIKWYQSRLLGGMRSLHLKTIKLSVFENLQTEKAANKYELAVIDMQIAILENPSMINIWKIIMVLPSITESDKLESEQFQHEIAKNLSQDIFLIKNKFESKVRKYIWSSFALNFIPILFIGFVSVLFLTFKISFSKISQFRLSNLIDLDEEIALFHNPATLQKISY